VELLRKDRLLKLKRKNLGNTILVKAIDAIIEDIEKGSWKSRQEVKDARPDADCVHNDGFYFFNISVHRTMILIELELEEEDDENQATVIWVGSHDEYEGTFKNNKGTIEKWLRSQGHIQ
jgi:mRNA-degrading endonuclease HigB of HigAB toxin-antitoxin module